MRDRNLKKSINFENDVTFITFAQSADTNYRNLNFVKPSSELETIGVGCVTFNGLHVYFDRLRINRLTIELMYLKIK